MFSSFISDFALQNNVNHKTNTDLYFRSIEKFQNIYISHRAEDLAPKFVSFGFHCICFMAFPNMTAGPPGPGRHVEIAISRCRESQKQNVLVPSLRNEPKNKYFEISSRMTYSSQPPTQLDSEAASQAKQQSQPASRQAS